MIQYDHVKTSCLTLLAKSWMILDVRRLGSSLLCLDVDQIDLVMSIFNLLSGRKKMPCIPACTLHPLNACRGIPTFVMINSSMNLLHHAAPSCIAVNSCVWCKETLVFAWFMLGRLAFFPDSDY